jgi:exocyst complex component 4
MSHIMTRNSDLKVMIQSSSCWRRAFGIKVKSDETDSTQSKLRKEARMVTDMLLDKNLTKENCIEDSSDMKALANLHESLEWLTLRLRKTFGRLNSEINAEDDILVNLNNILSRFQNISEQSLLYLHMEQRVRCFIFLGNMFKGARFDVKNSVALETDKEVTKLENEFRIIEEVLSSNLQSQKYRFVFEGLGHQLGSLLMEGSKLMTRISPAGVKKVCRNIFTLQQALTNITMNREPALDQARQYYELLYQRPDELVNTVEESGPKYSLDSYLTALSLSYKSMGDINIGDQTRHRQLESRLTEVCSNLKNLKSVNVDDYDF